MCALCPKSVISAHISQTNVDLIFWIIYAYFSCLGYFSRNNVISAQITHELFPDVGPCEGNDLLARSCKTLATFQDPNPDDLKNQLFIQQAVLLCTDPSTVYLLDGSGSTNPLLTRSSSIVP